MADGMRVFARWHALLGVALIVSGVGISWLASRRVGNDFAPFYVTGLGVANGIDVYAASEQPKLAVYMGADRPMGYPPATGVLLAPLAVLPFPIAKVAWFLLLIGSVCGGAWALVVRQGRL